MTTDHLVLGPFEFDDFSPPAKMPGGGKHHMNVHKLPGGSRVIDMLGPDDHDISWHGTFWMNGAYDQALQLDGLRSAGLPLPLMWGGQFYLVVIADFKYEVQRLPQCVHYQITCVVAQNPMNGGGIGGLVAGIGSLIGADLGVAAARIAGAASATLGRIGGPAGSIGGF